ncbi:hypothetical protein M0Q97_04425 [Candidatus Dojkabacteria bacterium]|jgi:hypothetical protein|nr:hypothetical protein [Candidatus Dojkabacteria bacterium]
MLNDIINNKKGNIGSLCLYLNNHHELLNELNNFISEKLSSELCVTLSLSQKIHIYYKNDTNIFCECGKQKNWKSFKYGWTKTCGNKTCIKNHTIKTNIEQYGADNPMKNDIIKTKSQQTIFEKYGVTSAAKNDMVKQKISNRLNNRSPEDKIKSKNKLLNTWNNKSETEKNDILKKRKNTVDNISDENKLKTIENRKKTCLEKYGNEYAVSSDVVRKKITKIFNENFGGNSPFCDENIKKKALVSYRKSHIEYITENIKKHQCKYISHIDNNGSIEYTLLCERKNKKFIIGYSNLRIRILADLEISPYFRPIYGKSEMEKGTLNFICDNYTNDILSNKKTIISPLELDIYLPKLNLAFEYNGLYWHNELNKEKNYHLNKTELCEQQGIQLIHIYEDDWLYKQDIIKSMILNKLGKTENKIFARICEINEITDNKLVRSFLDENHIQGFVGSKIKIGLFYENELVSLMTFGDRRVAMGKKSTNEGEYELLRFCNKLNTNVVGGASRLFKYFIKKFNPTEITTYADRSFSQGRLYNTLGFKNIGKTEPNYYYVIDGIRHHRFNYRKDILIKQGFDPNKTEHQIMLERKIYRIYDSGNLKFIFNI